MTRINAIRSIAGTRDSVAWGKDIRNIGISTWGTIHALAFAAVLIVCSVTVGCSSDRPKPANSNTQLPTAQMPAPPAPVVLADNKQNKPAAKKPVHKKPATVNYTDKNSGVTFEYPRRYAIETGDAAADLLVSSPIPMNFVAPGGVALAAVELPESSYANTDFSSAFFNVSVHKNLTPEQCNEFAVPAPKVVASAVVAEKMAPDAKTATAPATDGGSKPSESAVVATAKSSETQAGPVAESKPAAAAAPASTSSQSVASTEQPVAAKPSDVPAQPSMQTTVQAAASQPEPQGSKLLVGDMELRATEAVSGEGTRQSDSKYFHVYQNGSCYEFGLNVTTVAEQEGLIKHVDRDKVFTRLEQILDTVKINPVAAEVTAEAPSAPAVPATPAQ